MVRSVVVIKVLRFYVEVYVLVHFEKLNDTCNIQMKTRTAPVGLEAREQLRRLAPALHPSMDHSGSNM